MATVIKGGAHHLQADHWCESREDDFIQTPSHVHQLNQAPRVDEIRRQTPIDINPLQPLQRCLEWRVDLVVQYAIIRPIVAHAHDAENDRVTHGTSGVLERLVDQFDRLDLVQLKGVIIVGAERILRHPAVTPPHPLMRQGAEHKSGKYGSVL